MNKFLLVLSIFAVSAFLALTVGVSQALAGLPPTCTIICAAVSGACDGTNDSCLCEVAECFGTSGPDWMCGDAKSQVFHGGRGDDIICGRAGDDTLHGGWGLDDLRGEDDNDTLHGGHCADILDGGDGGTNDDSCFGGWGDDSDTECESNKEGKDVDHKSQGNCD